MRFRKITLSEARAQCELTLPVNSSDVDWNATTSVCTAGSVDNACPASATCCYVTLRVQNIRPVVSMMTRGGQTVGVFYPGFWQNDWWDDGWQLGDRGAPRAQATSLQLVNGFERGPNLVRHARILTVRNAVVTFNGQLLARGMRFGSSHLRMCRLGGMKKHGRRTACLQAPHVVVVHQKWADAFSHIFFQLLPQLVMLLDHAARARLPEPVLFLRHAEGHSNENVVYRLIDAALGIPHARVIRAQTGYAMQAQQASLLLLPPGNCPNFAIFPFAALSKVHQHLVAAPPEHERNLVVYLRRPCPLSRCLLNERALLAAIRASLIPPFELKIVEPGRVGGSSAAGSGWKDLRPVMMRARVIWGPCGSAWGNAFFHSATEDVHLIEINLLHGRASFVKQHHYIGGGSRYWIIEPRVRTARALSVQRHYEAHWMVPQDRLLAILHVAGVAHCKAAPTESEGVVPLIPCAMNNGTDEAWVELSPPPPPPPPPPPNHSPSPSPSLARTVAVRRRPRNTRTRGGRTSTRRYLGRAPSVRYSV